MQALSTANDILNRIILGKPQVIRLALTCLVARGHLLLEDLPGVGKTTLAHALARTLGLEYRRVQFTSDLLPGDILGGSVFDRTSSQFTFHPGPVFTQVLLADEINRASPKVQSALLEAMEERQVSVDGVSHALPSPFFVIATQNPSDQLGTFPLPESQYDRFLMRLSLGLPPREAEHALLTGIDRRVLLERLSATLQPAQLLQLQQKAAEVKLQPALADYILALLDATRSNGQFIDGLSPRAGLGLAAAARAWALLDGRDYVQPDDVKAVFIAVAGHRLVPRQPGLRVNDALQRLLDNVAIP